MISFQFPQVNLCVFSRLERSGVDHFIPARRFDSCYEVEPCQFRQEQDALTAAFCLLNHGQEPGHKRDVIRSAPNIAHRGVNQWKGDLLVVQGGGHPCEKERVNRKTRDNGNVSRTWLPTGMYPDYHAP